MSHLPTRGSPHAAAPPRCAPLHGYTTDPAASAALPPLAPGAAFPNCCALGPNRWIGGSPRRVRPRIGPPDPVSARRHRPPRSGESQSAGCRTPTGVPSSSPASIFRSPLARSPRAPSTARLPPATAAASAPASGPSHRAGTRDASFFGFRVSSGNGSRLLLAGDTCAVVTVPRQGQLHQPRTQIGKFDP